MQNIEAASVATVRASRFPNEFLFSVISLVVFVIIVQAAYAIVVRPRADALIEQQNAMQRTDPNYVSERSWYVIVKDYEQETCFILFLWSLALLGYKGASLMRDRKLLDADILHVPDGLRVLPQDAREYARQIEQLPRHQQSLFLPRVLIAALNRFGATQNVQDAASAAREVGESEASRLDSENAMLRYTTWAIPAIGFIGTVRGIGEALSSAHRAMSGDLSGVTAGLGVAFNSTFIALLISILIMFLLHNLQRSQERLLLDTETYVDNRLVRHMRAGDRA